MRTRLFLTLVCLTICSGTALAAGMSVHNEVTLRTAYHFDSDEYPEYRAFIQAHPECYQAGSPFPDWGYQFGYPEESEAAHWPPFMHFARPPKGRLLIAIGNGKGCRPSFFAPASSRRNAGRSRAAAG